MTRVYKSDKLLKKYDVKNMNKLLDTFNTNIVYIEKKGLLYVL
jgi:hypothetical protein